MTEEELKKALDEAYNSGAADATRDLQSEIEEAREGGYQAGYDAGNKEGLKGHAAGNWRRNVEQRIEDASWVYDDPTGQDADRVMEPLFEELIRARDYEQDQLDPDAAAERRHFEAAARYLP